MKSAALGLTCKDAFQVFSQNETLRLQQRVTELESRLAKYEPTKKVFENHDKFSAARLKADQFLADWIENNIHACSSQEYDHEGWQDSVCDVGELHQPIADYLQIMTLDWESCVYYSGKLLIHVNTALSAAKTASTEAEWCEDADFVGLIIHEALYDTTNSQIIHQVIDWESDDDQTDDDQMDDDQTDDDQTDNNE